MFPPPTGKYSLFFPFLSTSMLKSRPAWSGLLPLLEKEEEDSTVDFPVDPLWLMIPVRGMDVCYNVQFSRLCDIQEFPITNHLEWAVENVEKLTGYSYLNIFEVRSQKRWKVGTLGIEASDWVSTVSHPVNGVTIRCWGIQESTQVLKARGWHPWS